MKSALDARPLNLKFLKNDQPTLTNSENHISLQYYDDITLEIFKCLDSTDVRNDFSLVCKNWRIVSDDNTKIITIFQAYRIDENFIAISQRFKFLEKIYISAIWENLNPDRILTPSQLRRARFIDERTKGLKHRNPDHPYNLLAPITDDGVKHFKCLSELNLFEFPKVTYNCIKTFTNLKTLKLGCGAKITDNQLQKLTNLTAINLKLNSSIANDGIEKLTNLTTLNLHHNHLITHSAIMMLTKLTKLSLKFCDSFKRGNYLGLGNLVNLVSLKVSPKMVNSDISNLTNLTYLDCINSRKITEDGITNLTNLSHLAINSRINDIFMSGFQQLTYFKGLDLTDQTIFQLTNLKTLILDGGYNQVTWRGITSLTKLTHLEIFDSRLFSEDWTPYLTNITYLSLGGLYPLQNVARLTSSIKRLTNLNLFIDTNVLCSRQTHIWLK